MDAPKCRFCGKSEWRHVCEGVGMVVKETPRLPAKRPVRNEKRPVIDVEKVAKEIAKGFDRVTYQREYMRRRRLLKT